MSLEDELAALDARLAKIDAALSVGSRVYVETHDDGVVVEDAHGAHELLDGGDEALHIERQAVVDEIDRVRLELAVRDRAALDERTARRG